MWDILHCFFVFNAWNFKFIWYFFKWSSGQDFFRIGNIYPLAAHCELLKLKYICLGNLSSNYALNVYVTYVIKNENLQHIHTHTSENFNSTSNINIFEAWIFSYSFFKKTKPTIALSKSCRIYLRNNGFLHNIGKIGVNNYLD